MPSHIFVRLGHWDDAIDWNTRSAEAALRHPVNGATAMHYAHALDYLAYARLQQGQDDEAKAVVADLMAVGDFQPGFATAYAIAAVPARYPLERRRWDEAAALPVRTHGAFPWDRYPGAEAITHFARGLGAARSRDFAGAREAIGALDRLHAQMTDSGDTYWATLTDAQRKAVEAWVTFEDGTANEDGDGDRPLRLMREAADLEDSVDKHPVTPGAVLPARELLGDMLLLMERPEEALAAYEAALRISPNRFNSLYGAGRAAELAGNGAQASTYYAQLVELSAQDAHPAVTQAKEYLAQH
jgi:tetratricopeptide (TPR) repeat protein